MIFWGTQRKCDYSCLKSIQTQTNVRLHQSSLTIIWNVAVTEWVKIFPRQVSETYTSSATFMKQLTVIAISTITYLKNVFPEDSYTLDTFGGIRLRSLKKRCTHELAQFVSSALTQAFDAFDKRYLHQLVLCFYDGECSAANLIEYHVFEYAYDTEGTAVEVRSRAAGRESRARYTLAAVRESTLHLIRSCVVLTQCSQAPLPDTYDISIRLYYNSDAPEGYQAPGYLSTEENEDHLASTLAETIKLGTVETPYHKMTAHTYVRDSVGSSHEAIASQNPPPMSQMEQDDFEVYSDQLSASVRSDARVLCPCNKCDDDDDIGDEALLTCQYCARRQHAACFGVRREQAAMWSAHCCTECYDAAPQRTPTDRRLAELAPKKRECLCIFRRTLEWCGRGDGSVCVAQLARQFRMSTLNAAKLMKLLHSHGIVDQHSQHDLIAPRAIVRDQLKQVMSQFFHNDTPDIVDRLIAQTLEQTNTNDPVGEVLTNMEKVNLHNDTAAGKVIQTEQPNVTLDDTLREYRDAITLGDDKQNELPPLSGAHNPIHVEALGKRKLDARRNGVITKRAKTSRDNACRNML